jgi:folylpolyglutamate synthase/dihydropteroate synthase
MRDKDYVPMLRSLSAAVDDFVFCAPEGMERALPPSQLAAHQPGTVASSVRAAVTLARRLAGPRGLVVVAGSIFVVAAARAARLGLRTDPPIAM